MCCVYNNWHWHKRWAKWVLNMYIGVCMYTSYIYIFQLRIYPLHCAHVELCSVHKCMRWLLLVCVCAFQLLLLLSWFHYILFFCFLKFFYHDHTKWMRALIWIFTEIHGKENINSFCIHRSLFTIVSLTIDVYDQNQINHFELVLQFHSVAVQL